jgi:hypothetical protein
MMALLWTSMGLMNGDIHRDLMGINPLISPNIWENGD